MPATSMTVGDELRAIADSMITLLPYQAQRLFVLAAEADRLEQAERAAISAHARSAARLLETE